MRPSPRRLFVACAVIVSGLSACEKKPPPALEGDGVSAQATRTVAPFTRLSVGSRIEMVVTIGKESPLELQGDRNLLPHVTSRSENGTLTLDTDKPVKPSMRLRASVGVPRLDSASVFRAARLEIQGLAAETFEARAKDGAKLTAAGSAQALVLNGEGAGIFDFQNVATASATVRLERGSRADLGYLEKLDAKLSGVSSVSYPGSPEIKQEIQGHARLVQRGR